MKFFNSLFLLSILCLSFTLFGWIKPSTAQGQPNIPPYVEILQSQGAEVRYLGSDLGLNGWLTMANGRVQYVYSTPNGEANVVGVLLDSQGILVTEKQLTNFASNNKDTLQSLVSPSTATENTTATVPQASLQIADASPDQSSKAEQLLTDISKTNWVALGKDGAPVAYTVIDPDCLHCHYMMNKLKDAKAFEGGVVQVRIVPVGLIAKDSLSRAQNLLTMKNSPTAFLEHISEGGNKISKEEPVNLDMVKTNMAFLQDWNLDVTPFTVYKDKQGSIKIIRGVPKNMQNFINDISPIN